MWRLMFSELSTRTFMKLKLKYKSTKRQKSHLAAAVSSFWCWRPSRPRPVWALWSPPTASLPCPGSGGSGCSLRTGLCCPRRCSTTSSLYPAMGTAPVGRRKQISKVNIVLFAAGKIMQVISAIKAVFFKICSEVVSLSLGSTPNIAESSNLLNRI